jgi:hypothetical protein
VNKETMQSQVFLVSLEGVARLHLLDGLLVATLGKVHHGLRRAFGEARGSGAGPAWGWRRG